MRVPFFIFAGVVMVATSLSALFNLIERLRPIWDEPLMWRDTLAVTWWSVQFATLYCAAIALWCAA